MQIYRMYFEWPEGVTPESPGPHNIPANSLRDAVEAANKVFHGLRFATPPSGFALHDQAGNPLHTFIRGSDA